MRLRFEKALAVLLLMGGLVFVPSLLLANEAIIEPESGSLDTIYSITYVNQFADKADIQFKAHYESDWQGKFFEMEKEEATSTFSFSKLFITPGVKEFRIKTTVFSGSDADTKDDYVYGSLEVSANKDSKELYHRLILGRIIEGEFFPTTYFSDEDDVVIKFQYFASENVNEVSMYLADIDVTDYVLKNAVITMDDNFIEAELQGIPSYILSEVTKSNNNFISFTINGNVFTQAFSVMEETDDDTVFLPSDEDQDDRALPVAAATILTACVVGATSNLTVGIADLYIDMKTWYKIPYPVYNGKTSITSSDLKNLAISAGIGCGTGTLPVKYFFRKLPGGLTAEKLGQKAVIWLKDVVKTRGPNVKKAFQWFINKVQQMQYQSFWKNIRSFPGYLKEFSKRFLGAVGLKAGIKTILGY
jgi:hypothetical protein